MKEEFWTDRQVTEFFEIEDTFLAKLEQEEIVCPVAAKGLHQKSTYPVNWKKSGLQRYSLRIWVLTW